MQKQYVEQATTSRTYSLGFVTLTVRNTIWCPEKRALSFLRSDLALQDWSLKISTKSAESALFLRSVLTVQNRILKIRVLASLGE